MFFLGDRGPLGDPGSKGQQGPPGNALEVGPKGEKGDLGERGNLMSTQKYTLNVHKSHIIQYC